MYSCWRDSKSSQAQYNTLYCRRYANASWTSCVLRSLTSMNTCTVAAMNVGPERQGSRQNWPSSWPTWAGAILRPAQYFCQIQKFLAGVLAALAKKNVYHTNYFLSKLVNKMKETPTLPPLPKLGTNWTWGIKRNGLTRQLMTTFSMSSLLSYDNVNFCLLNVVTTTFKKTSSDDDF